MKTRTRNAATRTGKLLKLMPSHDKYDPRSNVVDCLTDLRHYCDAKGIDFHAACDTSYQHYLTERSLDRRNAKPAEDGGEG